MIRACAVAALGVLLLSACSEDPAPVDVSSGGILAWTVPDDDSGEDAAVGGLIGFDPDTGCLMLEPDDPAEGVEVRDVDAALLLPRGSTIASADPLTVEVEGHGTVGLGSEVQGRGLILPPPPELGIPAACLDPEGSVVYLYGG